MSKERLDALVVQRGLAESREQAQRLILAGEVLVDGRIGGKPGHRVGADAAIAVKERPRFVSRGGDKLEAALVRFGLDVAGRVCLDVGSSTGGFTDCLLQRGAARVYAVDVGKGQLHWKLRNDARVVVMEEVNARYLSPDALADRPSLAAVDVSFISLSKVLPAVVGALADAADIVTLIKPQFEAGPEKVSRGGVVRDAVTRAEVVESVRRFGAQRLGLGFEGVMESPLRGPAGNVEFLAHWRKGRDSSGGDV